MDCGQIEGIDMMIKDLFEMPGREKRKRSVFIMLIRAQG